jgi:hypothetical protein
MKSLDFLKEDIVTDAQDMQLDHEVQMARKDCYTAADNAIALHRLLRNISEQQGLEGWVAAKITLASDYLNTVREYLEYQLMTGSPMQEPISVMAVAESKLNEVDPRNFDSDVDYYAARNAPPKRRSAPNDYPFSKEEDDDYFREIFRKKREAKAKESGVTEGGRKMTGTPRDRFISTITPRMNNDALMQKVAKVVNSPEFNEDTILKIVDAGNTVTHPVARYIQKKFEELQYDLGRSYEDYPERVAEKLLSMLIDRTKQGVAESNDYSAVTNAITRRILQQHPQVLAKYGPEVVGLAIDEIAEFVGNVDEIGSSDVSGWTSQVIRSLSRFSPLREQGMSRAAKGMMKYGKTGMKKLAQLGREGAPEEKMNDTRDQYDKYKKDNKSVTEMNAGSVAGVVNPTPKNKAKTGTLFGGTYKQKRAK